MGLLDDTSDKPAVGGMSILRRLNQNNNFRPDTDSGPWSDFWDARGPFPFTLDSPKKEGGQSKAQIVFLTDIMIFPAHEIIVTWISARGKSFPKRDFIRAPGYDENGEPTGARDIVSEVKGTSPRIIGVAIVYSNQKYTPRATGKEQNYRVCPIIIKDYKTLEILDQVSQETGKSVEGAVFSVTRSGDPKAVSIGDIWTYKTHATDEQLGELPGNWQEDLAAIELEKGWVVPSDETIVRMLKKHVAVCDEHSGSTDRIVQYNKDAWERVSADPKAGEPAVVEEDSSDPLDDLDLD